MKKKIILQFNEANFELIQKYTKKYKLSGFKQIQDLPTKIQTQSEKDYRNLEPWIQWYSFYTNLNFDDHKIFHLGDCLKADHSTFLENNFKNIGIFGSMNIKPSKNFSVYIPDAWSEIDSDKSLSSRLVSNTLKKLVNNNSELKVNLSSLLGLAILIGFPKSYTDLKMIFKSLHAFAAKKRSILASVFDYFFVNYGLKRISKKKLDTSMIFLNGLAHIQHHYFLNSEFVEGNNPKWYCDEVLDPIYDTLKIYDKLFDNLLKKYKSTYEIWIVTGLTQLPTNKSIVYWRFKDHKKILDKFFDFKYEVYPRMTRDFEIKLNKNEDLNKAIEFFRNSKVTSKEQTQNSFDYIDIDYKNKRIFTTFIYNGVCKDAELFWNNKSIFLKDHLSFVAIKNGIHSENGWAFTNKRIISKDSHVPIWELSKHI